MNNPPPQSGGRNPWVDFKGEKRSRDTHESKTDPDAYTFKKSQYTAILFWWKKPAAWNQQTRRWIFEKTADPWCKISNTVYKKQNQGWTAWRESMGRAASGKVPPQ